MTDRAKAELFKMRTRARFPFLLHVHNDDLGDFRFANADESKTFEGEVYEAAFFTVDPPERTESSVGNARLTISAVDGEWIERIRTTQKRSAARFVAAITYGDGDREIIEPLEDNTFELTSAQWDDSTISWTMVFDDTMSVLVPCDTMGASAFPGCA